MAVWGLWTTRISKFQAFANIKKTIFIFKFEIKLKHWGWVVQKRPEVKSPFWGLFSLEVEDSIAIKAVIYIDIHYLTFTYNIYLLKCKLSCLAFLAM